MIPPSTTAEICLCTDSRRIQFNSRRVQSDSRIIHSNSTLNSEDLNAADMFDKPSTCRSLHTLEYQPPLVQNYRSLHALEYQNCLQQSKSCQVQTQTPQDQNSICSGKVHTYQTEAQCCTRPTEASPSQTPDCQVHIQTCKSMFTLEAKRPHKNKSFSLQMFHFSSFSSSSESVSAPLLDNTGNL